jgi:hypothetical protein
MRGEPIRIKAPLFVSSEEAIVHTLAVILSLLVLSISLVVYARRGGRRYLALSVAFVFLAMGELVQFAESFLFNAYIYLPFLDIHLSHFLDLAMLVSFGVALAVK